MECVVCSRTAEGRFCIHHQSAYEAVKAGYESWKVGYGTVEWEDYLNRVKHRAETGQWAKEVAELLSGGEYDKAET